MGEKTLDFPRGEGNNVKIAIYVPSTYDINKRINQKRFKKRVKGVVTFLRRKLGGSTTIKATGNYKSDELKKSVSENVAKVEAFTTRERYYKVDEDIEKFLNKKRKEWKQESLSYEYDNSLHLVLD